MLSTPFHPLPYFGRVVVNVHGGGWRSTSVQVHIRPLWPWYVVKTLYLKAAPLGNVGVLRSNLTSAHKKRLLGSPHGQNFRITVFSDAKIKLKSGPIPNSLLQDVYVQ